MHIAILIVVDAAVANSVQAIVGDAVAIVINVTGTIVGPSDPAFEIGSPTIGRCTLSVTGTGNSNSLSSLAASTVG